MKATLVTGASGFVGWHVARRLLERGERVRVLLRPTSRLRELDGAETVIGDLRQPESLRAAVEDCATVFHVAADYRLWARNPQELYDANAGGTRSLLEAARDAGVECFVYTSTVGCIGMAPGQVADESSPVKLEQMQGAYKRSKFIAEQTALRFAGEGFPVVVVNPTAPVGDHDFKPTPTGRIIVDFLRGGMPAYLDTGLNLVDVREVADGHLLARERGRRGQRYILGSENLTLREIFVRLERISGVRAPGLRLPYAVAYAAGLASCAWARLSGGEPRVPLDGVRMAAKKMFVSQDKAIRELGFAPSAVDGALERAVDWFRRNGYC